MKVLVIGANGFLGSNIVDKCLANGWKTDCIYNRHKQRLPKKGNIFHVNNLAALKCSYDVIFLVASFIPQDPKGKDFHLLLANIEIPLMVIEKFNKAKVIFSSSVSVYGTPFKSPINEQSPFCSPNLYGFSKIAGEFIMNFHKNSTIIRFSSLYGRGMSSDTFIPQVIKSAQKSKAINIWGDGTRRQDYLHVEDAADYCLAAARLPISGTFLGVYGKSYTNLQVAREVQKHFDGCKIKLTGKDCSPSFIYDNRYTLKKLKFKPRISLAEGINKQINNYV